MAKKNGKKETQTVEILDVSDIKFDGQNPRSHTDQNLEVIKNSVENFGFARSIVIDEDNQLLAGEGATRGSTAAGLKKVIVVDADGETIIAVRRTGLTQEQKDGLKVVDNRANELSNWNNERLVAILSQHADDPDKLHATGFTDEDLVHLLEGLEVTNKDLDEFFQDGGGFNPTDPGFKLTFTFTDEALFNSVKGKLTDEGKVTAEEGLLKLLKL